MSQFKVSKDCLVGKTEKSLRRKFLSGDFIIGADKDTPLFDKSSPLVLENAFRFNKATEFMEMYKFSSIENNEQYCITLVAAFDFTNEAFSKIFVQNALLNYDYFLLDKHKNIGMIAA